MQLIEKSPQSAYFFRKRILTEPSKFGLNRDRAENLIKSAYDLFMQDLANGEVDKLFGAEYGAAATLFELHNLYSNSLPNLYLKSLDLGAKIADMELSNKDVTKLKKRFERMEEELKESYNQEYNEKWLFLQFALTSKPIYEFPRPRKAIANIMKMKGMKGMGEFRQFFLREYKNFKNEKDIPEFLDMGNIRKMFEGIGFSQGVKFIDPSNFYEKLI